jgi:transposase
VVVHHQRHDRISVISALSISPTRQRLGLYWQFHVKNIQHPEVCDFLRDLLRHLRGHVIVLWDGAKIHRGHPIAKLCRRFPRLHLERLPGYAPELNPDEGVWSQAKQALANGRPDTLDHLWFELWLTLEDIRCSQGKLRACVHESDLPPFLP